MKSRHSIIALCVISFIASLLLDAAISTAADIPTIDTARLHALVMNNAYLLEAGRQQEPLFVVIIDARQRKEYAAAHVLSAISVPKKDFDTALALLPHDKSALLVVYGNAADPAAKQWADKAAAAGYANVEIYAEGFRAWKEKSMPVAPLEGGRP